MSGRERFEQWPAVSMRVGELVALMDDGSTPLVIDPARENACAVIARTTVDLRSVHIGRAVVLLFEDGDPGRPVIVGVLRCSGSDRPEGLPVQVDGQNLTISAQRELVLRCGKASITLTQAGKVLIEGSYVLSRSTGVNRVKGGSIHLN